MWDGESVDGKKAGQVGVADAAHPDIHWNPTKLQTVVLLPAVVQEGIESKLKLGGCPHKHAAHWLGLSVPLELDTEELLIAVRVLPAPLLWQDIAPVIQHFAAFH